MKSPEALLFYIRLSFIINFDSRHIKYTFFLLNFLSLSQLPVAGNPLKEEHIRWERVDYDMSEKTKVTYENGTSYLHISSAQREDIGQFRCIADNRVANPISSDVLLIVKCKFFL